MTDTNTSAPSAQPEDNPGILAEATEPDLASGAEQAEESAEGSRGSKAGRDAARYRARLREAETELQTVRAEVEAARDERDAARRGLVEHLASTEHRIKPAALWASGVELADLVDASGQVDPALVAGASETARSALGLATTPRPDLSQARGGGVVGPGFSAAFRPSGRR